MFIIEFNLLSNLYYSMYKIGIIGKGFVGSAVAHGFSAQTGYNADIKIFDINPSKSTHSLDETLNDSDLVFLSVPTPADEHGNNDLSIIENLFAQINELYNGNSIILLRSTVLPGTTRSISRKFPHLPLVFNPEFLTERSAKFDFLNQSRIILGGLKKHTQIVKEIYKHRFGKFLPIIETDYESAELIKYMNNIFFATKVSFLNEMKILAEKSNANWDDCINGFILDGRIGHSHIQVPGPDGKMGFGGSCFPKDIQALINYAKQLDVNINTVQGAWETNLQVRPEKDWEKLFGRAVSKNKK